MADDSGADLDETAAALLTESGYLNAMAWLYTELASGDLTRDQTSAYIGARRCLESFRDVRDGRLRSKEHQELVREMKLTREAMKQQGSGGTNFSDNQLSLPRRPSTGATSE